MRRRALVPALAVALLALPSPAPAPAQPGACLFTLGGRPYSVHVVRGKVSCATAGTALRRWLVNDRSPRGWKCRDPRGSERFDAQCRRLTGRAPRPLVRAIGGQD